MLTKKRLSESWKDILFYWNVEMGSIHPLSELLFKEKILNCEQLIDDLSCSLYLNQVYIGYIAVKKSVYSKNKNKIYISLMHVVKQTRNNGYGNYLLKPLLLFLEKTKYTEIVTGGDELCIFSGVFEKNNAFTHLFFKNKGFEVQSENVNLITNDSVDCKPISKNYQYQLGVSEEKKYQVLNLIEKHFSERWFDEIYLTDCCNIGAVIEADRVVGFINTGNVYSKIYPNSMNDYLLFKNLAGIGPLGILPKLQGKGIGLFMVKKTLQELFKNGASDIMVDWTGLEYFYKKTGFTKIHEKYTIYRYKMED